MKVPRAFCPTCKSKLDAVTGMELDGKTNRRHPLPGDVSVCAKCGEYLEFDAELIPRKASAAVLAELAPETLAIMDSLREPLRRRWLSGIWSRN